MAISAEAVASTKPASAAIELESLCMGWVSAVILPSDVSAATNMVKEELPHVEYGGELQAEAALIPAPNSP